MVIPFSSLLMASQGRYFPPPIIRIDHISFVLYKNTLDSGDWRYVSTNSETRQAGKATLTSENTVVEWVRQFLPEITSAGKPLPKGRLFHSLGYQRTSLKSQAFKSEGTISKTEEIHKLNKEKSTNSSTWPVSGVLGVCFSLSSPYENFECLNNSDRDLLNSLPCKVPPNRNHSIHSIMNMLNLFLKSMSLTMYNTCSGFSPSAGPVLTNGKIPSLARLHAWISTIVQKLTTKMYAPVANRNNIMMSSVSCSNCIQTRLVVQFVASLFVGSPKNLHSEHWTTPPSPKNLMFSTCIETQPLSTSLHPWKRFTLPSSMDCAFNTLHCVLEISRTASY